MIPDFWLGVRFLDRLRVDGAQRELGRIPAWPSKTQGPRLSARRLDYEVESRATGVWDFSPRVLRGAYLGDGGSSQRFRHRGPPGYRWGNKQKALCSVTRR